MNRGIRIHFHHHRPVLQRACIMHAVVEDVREASDEKHQRVVTWNVSSQTRRHQQVPKDLTRLPPQDECAHRK